MKQRIFLRQLVLVLLLVLVAIGSAIVLSSVAQYSEQPPECYTEQVKTMTIQEVSNLFGKSLVELTWFPEGRNFTPQVTTYSSIRDCSIIIDYSDLTSVLNAKPISISVYNFGAIQPTKLPPQCSLNFTPTAILYTHCSAEVDGSDLTVRVNLTLGPEFTREDAIRILESIKVVEPKELNPNAKTN